MSNVVALSRPRRFADLSAQVATFAQSFAFERRGGDDVHWLKENGEFLNILEASTVSFDPSALDVYAPVYDALPRRFAFFPMYYRFLLSICLDLEDLGMPGDTGEDLVKRCVKQDLMGSELSDLQRAEARRLLSRRGADTRVDVGLDDRLRAFCGRTETFSTPNKKAAYELTHIVFYLSKYGRQDPNLPESASASLHFAGLLAFLEGNVDLLSEICIAMRFADVAVPPQWMALLTSDVAGFDIVVAPQSSLQDDYHSYLMVQWYRFLSGQQHFSETVPEGSLRFVSHSPRGATALRELSVLLFDREDRMSDWSRMRTRLQQDLTPNALSSLDEAAQSTPHFDEFFQGFARARDGQIRLT